jgi:serine/threonine protein kinase
MGTFNTTGTSRQDGVFVKRFPDKPSYMAELNALRGLRGSGIAPEILAHDNGTRTIRIADAGVTLRSFRTELQQSFSMSQLRRFASGLFDSLARLHSADFCHYDVKDDNICIQAHARDDGSLDLERDFKVKLIDFGLSFKVDKIPDHYFNNKTLGTPVCRSPEHINGLPLHGKAADVFCAAATVLQVIEDMPEAFPLMFGNPERQIMAVRERVDLNRPLLSASGETVPKDVQAVLFSMLHPDPIERPSSKTCYHLLGLAGT